MLLPIAENDNEYIVLKNNQPTAVLMSVKEYKEFDDVYGKVMIAQSSLSIIPIKKKNTP